MNIYTEPAGPFLLQNGHKSLMSNINNQEYQKFEFFR